MSEDRQNGLAPVHGILYGIALSVAFFWVPCAGLYIWLVSGVTEKHVLELSALFYVAVWTWAFSRWKR